MANTAQATPVLGKLWKLPSLDAATAAPAKVETDIAPIFQDAGKKAVVPGGAYAQAVTKLRKAETFSAALGSTSFLRFGGKKGTENVLLLGMGQAEQLTEEKARQAGGHAWAKLNAEKASSILVQADLFATKGGIALPLLRAFAEGLILGAYQFKKHKSEESGNSKYTGPSKITFLTKDKNLKAELARELAEARAAGEAANITRDWSNEPSNFGTPEGYAAAAKELAKEYGLTCRVLNKADAKKERMNLFLAVGQGSEREGRVVVLEYTPKNAGPNTKTVALIGKGVTFDSGGISIKPSMRMEEMKHDMTGAATIMGAMALVARWQVPNRVVAVLGFTENMPSGIAVQPGNVITARNGKTVEIINTDAEGRLVLADILDYAQEQFKPDAMVDVATLTGAVTVALGKQCCAILGNDPVLNAEVKRVGDGLGEKIWELPLYDEYFEDLKSETADMRNSANDSYGGTIRGAIFLKQFIRKGVRWSHLDIAATSYNVTHLPYLPKRGASGLHVRTLARFARDFTG